MPPMNLPKSTWKKCRSKCNYSYYKYEQVFHCKPNLSFRNYFSACTVEQTTIYKKMWLLDIIAVAYIINKASFW